MRRPQIWLAHLVAGLGLTAVAGTAALVIGSGAGLGAVASDAYGPATFATGAAFPITGWIIATRRPGNAIGWIFLVIGLSQGLAAFASMYALLFAGGAQLPLATEAAWLSSWVWAPGFVLLITLSALLFPDGRPPSPRWRIVVVLALAALVVMVVPGAAWAWPQREALVAGADASALPGGDAISLVTDVAMVMVIVAAVGSIAGMLVRFKRSRGVERRQLKWFTFAAAIQLTYGSLIAVLPGLLPGLWWLWALIGVLVAPLLPASAAIAILRYRLYEIDRIVSRTVAWSVVTGVLLAVFAVLVIALQEVLSGVTQGQTLAVAASTLAAFALFQPLRRAVQHGVDRRFNRSRSDGESLSRAFGLRLRDETDPGSAHDELVSVSIAAVEPQSAAVWLRRGAAQ